MSTCISRHGEYSSHEYGSLTETSTTEERFTCRLCGVLDVPALLAEVQRLDDERLNHNDLLRAIEALEAERDEANRARYLAEQYHDDALAREADTEADLGGWVARALAAEERVDGQAWEELEAEAQRLREGIAAALEPCGCRWERCSCADDDLRVLLAPSDGSGQ